MVISQTFFKGHGKTELRRKEIFFDLSLSRAPALLPFAPPAVREKRENGVDIICTKRI